MCGWELCVGRPASWSQRKRLQEGRTLVGGALPERGRGGDGVIVQTQEQHPHAERGNTSPLSARLSDLHRHPPASSSAPSFNDITYFLHFTFTSTRSTQHQPSPSLSHPPAEYVRRCAHRWQPSPSGNTRSLLEFQSLYIIVKVVIQRYCNLRASSGSGRIHSAINFSKKTCFRAATLRRPRKLPRRRHQSQPQLVTQPLLATPSAATSTASREESSPFGCLADTKESGPPGSL